MQREVIEETPLWALITIDHEHTVSIELSDSIPTKQKIEDSLANLKLAYTNCVRIYSKAKEENPQLPNLRIPSPKVKILPTNYLKANFPNYAEYLAILPRKPFVDMEEVASKIIKLEEDYREQTSFIQDFINQNEYLYKLKDGNSIQRAGQEQESILYLKNALLINKNNPINQVGQFLVYPELCMLVDLNKHAEAQILASYIFGNVVIDDRVSIGYIPVGFAYKVFVFDKSELLVTQADLIYQA